MKLETKTFTFKDGREITLKEPTILQLESAQKKAQGDDLRVAKNLLVDMSDGELTIDGINALSLREFKRLSECVSEFMGVDARD